VNGLLLSTIPSGAGGAGGSGTDILARFQRHSHVLICRDLACASNVTSSTVAAVVKVLATDEKAHGDKEQGANLR